MPWDLWLVSLGQCSLIAMQPLVLCRAFVLQDLWASLLGWWPEGYYGRKGLSRLILLIEGLPLCLRIKTTLYVHPLQAIVSVYSTRFNNAFIALTTSA